MSAHHHSHSHTHDHIDWADRLTQLRTADTLDADAQSAIARRLVAALPRGATIVDLGCGAGGMSTHFATALASHGGGTLILVDATPELLAVAEETVKAAASGGPSAAGSGAAPAVAVPGGIGSGAGVSPAGPVATGVAGTVGSGAGVAPAGSVATGVADTVGSDDAVAPDGSAAMGAAERVGSGDAVAPAGSVETGVADEVGSGAGVSPAGPVATGVAGSGSGPVPAGGSGAVGAGPVEVRAVLGDLADAELPESLPAADLVWASRVVHHLPDQQAAVGTLARVAKAGGLVALAEGGLDFRCLPWDLGIGRPGLEDRLLAAQAEWFIGMREGIEGAVAMPYGWSTALEHAGLTDVDSFGALVHHPSPGPAMLADYVVHRITRIFEFGGEYLTPDDRETLTSLLDPDGPHHLAARHDLYLTGAKIVHCGRRP
ncbi:methyltransferase domain-containing protein [Amycolatopsis sp. NPDC051903]|uniref:methyltransferase domain-containing protein n=1 Tax=Amycolatopsis sp. NPDC051903 TaxID=3363936 RepID=UPI0037AFF3C5